VKSPTCLRLVVQITSLNKISHSLFSSALVLLKRLSTQPNYWQLGGYQSIIVIGAIIKGDTDHYEYVCQYVTNGISQLSAMHTTPIIFGILTTQNELLAYERAAVDKMNKGQSFAETALFMIRAFENLHQ